MNLVGRELMRKYKNEVVGIIGESIKIQTDHQSRLSFEGGCNSHCWGCMNEVEKVMEELSNKGEFGFGSFWCKEEESDELIFPTCLESKEFVNHHLIEMVASLNCS